MSLVTLKEILAPANEKNYAVAAFDTMDFTLTEGIIEAAEQTGLPVILMLPGFAFDRQETDAFLVSTSAGLKGQSSHLLSPGPRRFH